MLNMKNWTCINFNFVLVKNRKKHKLAKSMPLNPYYYIISEVSQAIFIIATDVSGSRP